MFHQEVGREEGSLGSTMKWATLEKQSITIRMVVLPPDAGSLVTKYRTTGARSRSYSGRRLRTPL